MVAGRRHTLSRGENFTKQYYNLEQWEKQGSAFLCRQLFSENTTIQQIRQRVRNMTSSYIHDALCNNNNNNNNNSIDLQEDMLKLIGAFPFEQDAMKTALSFQSQVKQLPLLKPD